MIFLQNIETGYKKLIQATLLILCGIRADIYFSMDFIDYVNLFIKERRSFP